MPFYKLETDVAAEATNVDGPGFSLCEVAKDHHVYPVEGWYWFADAEIARVFFGLPVVVPTPADLELALLGRIDAITN